MKAKQLLFAGLIASVFSLTMKAASAQVEVGVRAGLNLSSAVAKDDDGNSMLENPKLNPGFNVGFTFDIQIADEVYLQPAALFSTKGAKDSYKEDGVIYSSTATPYYIEVPVNILYKTALGKGKLLLGAGPYLGYGIGGRWKGAATENGSSYSEEGKLEFIDDVRNESEDDDIRPYGKPLDYGANLLAGYEFSNRFSVQLNAQLGLANISPKWDGKKSGETIKNRGFGISFGYKF